MSSSIEIASTLIAKKITRYYALANKTCPAVIQQNLYSKQYHRVRTTLVRVFTTLNLFQTDASLTNTTLIDAIAEAFIEKLIRSLAQPGECVGIVCAHSIGEKQTQTTLNHFHKAGSNDTFLSSGVGRFQEILNSSKNPKSPSCPFFFKTPIKTDVHVSDVRAYLGNITFLRFLDFVDYFELESITTSTRSARHWWREEGGDDVEDPHRRRVSFVLKAELLYRYKIHPYELGERLLLPPGHAFEASHPHEHTLDVYLSEETAADEVARGVFMSRLIRTPMCGVEGVTDVILAKSDETGTWIGQIQGSPCLRNLCNYRNEAGHKILCAKNTISNDIWEIYKVLGIEATRSYLIEEYMAIMEGINECHVRILAEKMTFTGSITSISRYTTRKDEGSAVFSKGAFEETIDHFCKAAVMGDCDPVAGVSASIICGKRTTTGTGMVRLAEKK
jgi:hypothetical protein